MKLVKADYCQIIKQEDIKGFLSRDDEISAGKKYMLEYSITINDEEILLQDKGSPYFSKNGTVSFTFAQLTEYCQMKLF